MKSSILFFAKKRILLVIFLSLYSVFSVLTYRDYGLTMDEFFVYTRGQYFYNKVAGNDKLLQKGFVIREKKNENLLYYNSTYAAFLYALNDSDTYENYHLLNLLFGALLFIFTYELLLLLYSKPYLAIIGPIFLFVTPRLLGHMPTNPKDIPFASAYMASLFFIFALRKTNTQLRLLILGIVIGITASFRFIGFSLIFLYAFFMLYQAYLEKTSHYMKLLWNVFLECTVLFFISFCLFMMSMPYVAADPFNHLIELIQVNKLYPWKGFSYFLGSYITEVSRPWYYLPVWFLITTPVFILVLAVLSIVITKNKDQKLLFGLLLGSIALHLLMYFALAPVIYNGLRHYLFILVHIVLLAAIAFNEILLRKQYIRLFFVGISLHIISILFFYIIIHPYQYTYFNIAVGGIKHAASYFETDYWGASDKEALTKLRSYLAENEKQKVSVYTCSQSASLSYYLPEVFSSNSNIKNADYIVCIDSMANEKIQKEMDVTLIDTVSRYGRNFNYIYKVNKKT